MYDESVPGEKHEVTGISVHRSEKSFNQHSVHAEREAANDVELNVINQSPTVSVCAETTVSQKLGCQPIKVHDLEHIPVIIEGNKLSGLVDGGSMVLVIAHSALSGVDLLTKPCHGKIKLQGPFDQGVIADVYSLDIKLDNSGCAEIPVQTMTFCVVDKINGGHQVIIPETTAHEIRVHANHPVKLSVLNNNIVDSIAKTPSDVDYTQTSITKESNNVENADNDDIACGDDDDDDINDDNEFSNIDCVEYGKRDIVDPNNLQCLIQDQQNDTSLKPLFEMAKRGKGGLCI